jgi:DNA-binding NarL/FixJ family response regulator
VVIVCRAELLLLGLERLLVQAPDLRVFTYAALPESALAPEPAFEGETVREERLRPPPRRGPVRVALLSDRDAPDLVGDCEQLLEGFVDEVVVLSSRPDIASVLGCMGAGARTFVMEGDPPEELFAAVRSGAEHRAYMGRRTLEIVVEWLAEQERPERRQARQREDRDLLRLLAEGRSTGDIAESLGIAPKTVRNRLSKLYRRLGVRSRAAAVRLAEERGLLDPADRGRRPR